MPQVIAWQCPHTGKLFVSNAEYRRHLHALARERIAQRKHDAFKKAIEDRLATMRDICNSFDDAARFIEENPSLFLENRFDNRAKAIAKAAEFRIYDVQFKSMQFKKSVSNTHYAPLDKPTNFMCEEHLPRGYPGYMGRIMFHAPDTSDFRIWFRGTGINIGSGGGGGFSHMFSYEVALFAHDWRFILREATFSRLQGNW
jgi:hypothetical protein